VFPDDDAAERHAQGRGRDREAAAERRGRDLDLVGEDDRDAGDAQRDAADLPGREALAGGEQVREREAERPAWRLAGAR
jgi:hypothetical protein